MSDRSPLAELFLMVAGGILGTRVDTAALPMIDDRLRQVGERMAALEEQHRQDSAAIRSDLAVVQTGVDELPARVVEALRAQPPPPPAARHQLRAPAPDFVGRTTELAQLTAALRQASGQASAITGVRGLGGVGKTELALVVGQQLRDAFPDAQIELDLRGSRPTEALSSVQALQQVIRVFAPTAQLPEAERELIALYRHVMTDRRVLILADDARNAAQVRPLLPPAGSVLLITSRQRFTLEGMQPVIDLDMLPPEQAVALLTRLCPELSVADAHTIAHLCGYLPLALRTSAGTLTNSTRPPSRYITVLGNERRRLAQLRAPDDPNLDVDASLTLSYASLEVDVQQALTRLGVFAGSFDRAAAQAVLAAPDDDALDTLLDALHGRSLLDHDPAQDRFSLHELVRLFALDHLIETGAERVVRLRHVQHYIQVAGTADQLFLTGGDQLHVGLDLFDRERANLDAAWDWLQQQQPSDDTDALLIAAAEATVYIGDLRYATRGARLPQLHAALAAAQRFGQRASQGVFLGNLGNVYADLGEAQRAIGFHEQHLAIARELGDQRGEGNALGNLGLAYAALGDVQRAISCYEQRLIVARAIGDRQGEAETAGNFGRLLVQEGELVRGQALLEQSLHYHQEIGHPHTATIEATLAHVRAHGTLPAEQPDFAALLRDCARVAVGDGAPRAAVEAVLAELEQGGWLLRGPVERIWAGERDHDTLIAGLDVQDTQLIEQVLELVGAYERGERRTPAQVFADLPEAVRAAIEQSDEAARDAALAALPEDERARVAALLAELHHAGTPGG